MRKRKKVPYKFNKISVGYLVLVLLIVFFIAQQLQQSILFNHKDRINILFYDSNPVMYSIGTVDNVHYKLEFDPQTTMLIPGGYGSYKLKSLGELAHLDNKPSIIQKGFSSLMSSTVHFYFYKNPNTKDRENDFSKIMFYQSNVSMLNRIILGFIISQKKQSDFSLIRIDNKDAILDTSLEDSLLNKFQGYFYQNDLRAENKNVQLIFHTRSSINTLSRVIEGDGIRVVDLTYHDEIGKRCTITTNSNAPSTEHYFSSLFRCIIKRGDTGGQDMIIELGSDIEQEWE